MAVGYDYYNFTKTKIGKNWECLHHDWLTNCDEWGWKYFDEEIPASWCSSHKYTYEIKTQPSQFLMSSNGALFALDYLRSLVLSTDPGYLKKIGGKLSPAPIFENYYSVQSDTHEQKILDLCNSTLGMKCNKLTTRLEYFDNKKFACGATPRLYGSSFIPDTSDLNNPMGMAASPSGDKLVIADSQAIIK